MKVEVPELAGQLIETNQRLARVEGLLAELVQLRQVPHQW